MSASNGKHTQHRSKRKRSDHFEAVAWAVGCGMARGANVRT